MNFSELPGPTSPETSPGLWPGLNVRGKFKHCHPQILNRIGHSYTYVLYPLYITYPLSDLQIFDILNNECLLLEKVCLHVSSYGLLKLGGTLLKEAVYELIS